ncbi:hypothetical protein, partial [Frisingicoccus sp.]|uniref:hypothetical protein n=1 Tax=Frisingicoccus sp. TaxID=1918627 RepID=UPI003AB2E858
YLLPVSDQCQAVVLFWYSFFNLYKIFKVPYFLLDFLFADLFIGYSEQKGEFSYILKNIPAPSPNHRRSFRKTIFPDNIQHRLPGHTLSSKDYELSG